MSEHKYKKGDSVVLSDVQEGHSVPFAGKTVVIHTLWNSGGRIGYSFTSDNGDTITVYKEEIRCLSEPEFKTGEEVYAGTMKK